MALTPPPHASQIVISADDAGHLVIALSGEIDIDNADGLGQQISAAIDSTTEVVVDLSDVAFMDTSGIAVLLDTANTAASLQLRNPSKQVRRVVEASGLTSILWMTP